MTARPPTVPRRSSALRVNVDYREFLEQRGLTTAAGFLALTGVIVCGHPNRHVLRVTLGSGDDTLTAFLKREHRISWISRLLNAWAGFGFVSQSCREATLLRQLQRAGVPCPEWLAAGEDSDGRAFLLLRELTGAVDLRLFLHGQTDVVRRRRLARKLGETLAHMHDAGFDHPDLYAKHVLVNPRDLTVHILDWQRSRRRPHLDWPRRWRDLAALHASLADALAAPRERLACLRAYLRATVPGRVLRCFRRTVVSQVERRAEKLLRHRHIGEQRQLPPTDGVQRLIWLDGEALCVTPELHAALSRQAGNTASPTLPNTGSRSAPALATLSGPFQATLVRRRARWPLRWFWNWLRGKHLMSRELHQAGLLFRLQRYGVGTPRLLAFGQKHFPPRRTESFLLTEAPPNTVGFADWLSSRTEQPLWTAQHKQRRRLIREAARVVRRMHEARCYHLADAALQVQERANQAPGVVLGSVEDLQPRRRPSPRQMIADLARLLRTLPRRSFSRADALRFLLAYVGEPRLTPPTRDLATAVVRAVQGSFLARLVQWFFPPRAHIGRNAG